MYIQVAVNVPQVSGVFDYHLPDNLVTKVTPGCLVEVPFNKQTVQGITLRFVEQPQVLQTRPILNLLDDVPVVNSSQIQLATWLSRQSFSSLAECLHLMLPPGLSQKADTLYVLTPGEKEASEDHSDLQKRILNLINQRDGEITSRQLARAFAHQNWKAGIGSLIKHGIIQAKPILQEPVAGPKHILTAQLICTEESARAAMPSLGRGNANTRRQAMLEFLIQEAPQPVAVSWVYAAAPDGKGSQADLKVLEKLGLIALNEEETWRDPLAGINVTRKTAPILTHDQKEIAQTMIAGMHAAQKGKRLKPYLLQGVTGSGKTEIYLELVETILAEGKQAVILIPEISLTPQTAERFTARFPGKVGMIHSRLSMGERYDTWRRARSGNLSIIIGPRSALFTNLPQLGLIIIDEFEDDSFYQSDLRPFYSTVRTALAYAYIKNIPILLGSATPDISWRYQAELDRWNIFHLPDRYKAHQAAIENHLQNQSLPVTTIPTTEGFIDSLLQTLPLPPVQIVDMRKELKEGNRSIFSRSLQSGIENVLQKQEQAILYLNRRGSATYVFCRDCGKSLICPNCEIALTYHESIEQLICHVCNYQRKMPKTCPACGSQNIRQFGTGTEKVEKDITLRFPQARILRLDAGTIQKKGSFNQILERFSTHQADILVGTQMLAKGLDLPLVTLVGVVLADVGLNLPDYRAGERVFQLLMQVAGRAGRSALGGSVVFQTFNPDNYAIQAAATHQYDQFYQLEIKQRQKIHYPPFCRLARLEFNHTDPHEAEDKARSMAIQIQSKLESGQFPSSDIIGPAPCYYQRRARTYRWQIIIRSPDPFQILKDLQLNGCSIEIDPPSLL